MSTRSRLGVLAPAAAVLGYLLAGVCLVAGVLLLAAPEPDPVPLADGGAVVPGAAFLHPGSAVLVPDGTPDEVVDGLVCQGTGPSGAEVGRFGQGLSRAAELPDGTPVTEVLTASGVRGGDTVRCEGAGGTPLWVAQDGSARGVTGVAALVAAPLLAVGATVLLVVGLAARRRP